MTGRASVGRTVTVEGARRLRGTLQVPGDKSVSHRAVMLGALAEGRTVIRGLSQGDDVRRTAGAVQALGAVVDHRPDKAGAETAVVGGDLREPESVLYLGNSATATRLMAGLVAPFSWLTVIEGDASVNSRPMARVVDPLRRMGARIEGREGGSLAPLVVRGGGLQGITYTVPVASAQVKSAVLLAGLGADGETVVSEPLTTRAHTEEMLAMCGADVEVQPSGRGRVVRVQRSKLQPFELDVPGDPSQAAFWLVAACICDRSDVVVRNTYVGTARSGFIDVLARMGASIEVAPTGGSVADIRARHSPLSATSVEAEEVPSLLDEIPVLAVAAAFAEGTTVFDGVGELRVKESDRLDALVKDLRALGCNAFAEGGRLVVEGAGLLSGGRVESFGDHRIAMAMAVAGAGSRGRTEIGGWEAVSTSYPGFLEDLAALSDGRQGRG